MIEFKACNYIRPSVDMCIQKSKQIIKYCCLDLQFASLNLSLKIKKKNQSFHEDQAGASLKL